MWGVKLCVVKFCGVKLCGVKLCGVKLCVVKLSWGYCCFEFGLSVVNGEDGWSVIDR